MGFPPGDLKLDKEPPPEGMGYEALCEGCGHTLINEKGDCIYPHCLLKHGVKTDVILKT